MPLAIIPFLALLPADGARKAKSDGTKPDAAAAGGMSRDERALHVLNRLGFGPRPGEVEQVRTEGEMKWAERQLHPESIPENPLLLSKLAPLSTLRMSSSEMAAKYPPITLIRQMETGRIPWPQDPEARFLAQKQAERYKARFARSKETNAAGGSNLATTAEMKDPVSTAPEKSEQLQAFAAVPGKSFEEALAPLSPAQRGVLLNGTVPEEVELLKSLPLEQQYDLVTALPPGQRLRLFAHAGPDYRRRMESFNGAMRLVNQDLFDNKIYRAVYSNRQLQEVLTDFWFNHFNVFLDKGADRYLVTSYERDAIRPFVLGKFQDLLTATAQSPAMLFYLDNYESVKADFQQNPRLAKIAPKRGLNENYGRELMELHTLGVDGGYTQKDVTEVARCFTGWTIRDPRRGGEFEFNARQHDNGEKHVLGVTIPAGGGIQDGYRVIDILAHHPSTARFVSKSLAVRFVSDNPPASLVDRMAATFTKTDGDLREVMLTLIHSPEFWAKDAYRAKIKSPFEMLVSALRATNADVEYAELLTNQLKILGEPLYRKQEPTGYSNTSAEWMNSAALLGRMNFALNLTSNHVNGVNVALPSTTDPDSMAKQLIGSTLTSDSRRIIDMQAQHPPSSNKETNGSSAEPAAPNPALIAGLTLGSPDFQRR